MTEKDSKTSVPDPPWQVVLTPAPGHVPYWLRPRDEAVERRHVELMRRFHQELQD